MKKLLLFLSILGLFLSCNKEIETIPINETTPESAKLSDRLAFENPDEMLDLYMVFSKMSPDELRLWARKKDHSTLLDSQESSILDYSNALKTILNKDSEFQVGDSIIRFKDGDFLAYSIYDCEDISLEEMRKTGHVDIAPIREKSSKSVILGAGQTDARHQHEFIITQYIPCVGNPEYGIFGYRKFVTDLYHEFISYSVGYPFYRFISTLYMHVKLEYRTSRSNWYICHNEHKVNYSISGSTTFTGDYIEPQTYNYSYVRYYTGCGDILTNPLNVFIAQVQGYYDGFPFNPLWNTYMNGYVTQQINGDPSPWTFPSSGSVLW